MTQEQYARKTKPFSLIPNEILDTAPNYHIIMVWCAIWRHGNGSDQGCWASLQRISRYARIGRDRTRDAIKWLKDNHWLVAVERPGFTTCYHATLEGGLPEIQERVPLSSARWGPLLDTSTPTGDQDHPPTGYQGGNNIPLITSLEFSSNSSFQELSTEKGENEFSPAFSVPKTRARTKGPELFERFWKLYLSAPVRAASQSKPKALQQWNKIIRTEQPDSLLEALQSEIDVQHAAAGGFVSPLPDCFRWLRDERYATVSDHPIPAGIIPDVIR